MISLVKLIPLTAFVSGTMANSDVIKEKYDKLINYSKTVSIQTEVNQIAKMIYLDSIDDVYLKEADFKGYLQKNMSQKRGGTRDLTKDIYGNEYDYSVDKEGFTVTSAGHDLEIDTDDDIYSGYDY